MRPNYLIASNPLWDKHLADNLEKKIDGRFYVIRNQNELNLSSLEKISPDYIFFPHWSHIIPPDIHENYECIIFHMTDLPFGRGGSPLQNLITRGIYETKMSAIKCVKELDAGPIYLKMPLKLHGNAQQIFIRATKIIEEMIIEIITAKTIPVPQVGDPVIFQRRAPQDGNISSLDDLTQVYDYIRMLDADRYPRAFIETDRFRFEFESASFDGKSIKADVKIVEKK